MRKLLAFLVAIDQYDQPEINDLDGCLNDLEGMQQSLESYCHASQKLHLHHTVLTNRAATRQAVIDGFTFFDQAKNGDVCLFYFSGHGAQIDMPPEFWDEADRMLEAIVCHVDQGNDNLLIDKELSFLIAEAQRDKELHFVVIADCCHSGSNTKGDLFNVRTVKPNLNVRKVDDYLGRNAYEEAMVDGGKRRQLNPPLGKHLKLAACTSADLAKEKRLGEDGKMRGVFTYSLLQVLKDNGYNLSYLDLIRKIRMKAQLLATDQSPQLETVGLHPSRCNSLFLDGLLEGQRPAFKVSLEELRDHDHQIRQQWIIGVGHIYGLKKGDVAILENNQKVTINEVYATYSVLDPQPLRALDKGRTYTARVRPGARKILNLDFSADSNQEAINLINTVFAQKSFPFIQFSAGKGIDYSVHVVDDLLFFTHPDGNMPIFARIHGHDESTAMRFLTIVDQIAEWHHIVAINNAEPSIREEEVSIHLARVKNPHTFGTPDSATSIPIENWQEENVFRYIFDGEHPAGPWHLPAFQLSITNQSKGKLWVSALYCGVGYDNSAGPPYPSTVFSIENRFLEKVELAPGGTESMTDVVDNFILGRTDTYKSIELSVLDDYFDQGYNEIKDRIKIFVSRNEIDTKPFIGKGILLDVEMSSQRFSRPGNELPSWFDWRSFEMPITIVRPRDMGVINSKQNKMFYNSNLNETFYGLTIVGHTTFSARVIPSTVEELIRSTRLMINERPRYMPRPEIFFGNEQVSTIQLTSGLGAIEGVSVIEFYRTEGASFISQDKPLIFQVATQLKVPTKNHKLVLVGYSAEQRAYYALGVMDEKREIKIAQLPTDSPSLIEGLGNSIKLLLLNVQQDFEIPPYK